MALIYHPIQLNLLSNSERVSLSCFLQELCENVSVMAANTL